MEVCNAIGVNQPVNVIGQWMMREREMANSFFCCCFVQTYWLTDWLIKSADYHQAVLMTTPSLLHKKFYIEDESCDVWFVQQSNSSSVCLLLLFGASWELSTGQFSKWQMYWRHRVTVHWVDWVECHFFISIDVVCSKYFHAVMRQSPVHQLPCNCLIEFLLSKVQSWVWGFN